MSTAITGAKITFSLRPPQDPFVGFTAKCADLDGKLEAFRNKVNSTPQSERRNLASEFNEFQFAQMDLEDIITDVPYFDARPGSKELIDALKSKIDEIGKLVSNYKLIKKDETVSLVFSSAMVGATLGLAGKALRSMKTTLAQPTRPVKQTAPDEPEALDRKEFSFAPSIWRKSVMRCYDSQGSGAAGQPESNRDNDIQGGRDYDAQFAEAERFREAAKIFEKDMGLHLDESLSSMHEWRPYNSRDEFISAYEDWCASRDYYTEANRIENEVAQEMATDSGCLIS